MGNYEPKKDIVHKFSIAQKEIPETDCWLRLLLQSEIVSNEKGNELLELNTELLKIGTPIIRSAKNE